MAKDGWAQVGCKTCGMPVRVLFKDSKIINVLAVCKHVEKPSA